MKGRPITPELPEMPGITEVTGLPVMNVMP